MQKLFCWVIILASLTAQSASGASHGDLYRVKKIYLQATQDGYELSDWGEAAVKRWHSILRPALTKYGFVVVDQSSDADAILYSEVSPRVTLDGPQPDPPKYSVNFRLTSVKFDVEWKTAFDIRSRASEADVEQQAIERVIRNLFAAWKKSATKARITVGDRLP